MLLGCLCSVVRCGLCCVMADLSVCWGEADVMMMMGHV